MLKSNDIREILKIGVILFLITAISAGVLAAVNSLTAPVIKANAEKKQNEAMAKVLPEAQSFELIELENLTGSATAVYSAKDAGYVVLCEPNGYGGAISMAVGVKKDGTVSGIDIISQSETAGLGANCTKDEFKAQFAGKTSGITVSKNGAKDNQIDAISSATITSKAVTKGVNDALDAVAGLEAE